MNVLPAGFTPPIGMRRTITDECLGMWAFSSVYSAKYDHYETNERACRHHILPNPYQLRIQLGEWSVKYNLIIDNLL